jgi:DNA-3-methyladenine glycosylase I
MKSRCEWPGHTDDVMIAYHDTEWGVPMHDDQKLFEFIVLESAQAGLSWRTILHRREGYRKAFANFDPTIVAQFTDTDLERLLQDVGIIRNRLKVKATITNAQAFLKIQEEFGSFDNFIWKYVKEQPIVNKWKKITEIPATSTLSDRVSMDLKKRGFKFLGSTVMYAHMQATGMVNDHIVSCFRYKEVQR